MLLSPANLLMLFLLCTDSVRREKFEETDAAKADELMQRFNVILSGFVIHFHFLVSYGLKLKLI